MRIDRVDPAYLDRLYEQLGRTQEQQDRQQRYEEVLGKDEEIGEWERTHLEELEENVRKLNKAAETFEMNINFRVKEEEEQITVEAVDREAEEVVREVPPERVLNMVAQIQNLIGLFVDVRR